MPKFGGRDFLGLQGAYSSTSPNFDIGGTIYGDEDFLYDDDDWEDYGQYHTRGGWNPWGRQRGRGVPVNDYYVDDWEYPHPAYYDEVGYLSDSGVDYDLPYRQPRPRRHRCSRSRSRSRNRHTNNRSRDVNVNVYHHLVDNTPAAAAYPQHQQSAPIDLSSMLRNSLYGSRHLLSRPHPPLPRSLPRQLQLPNGGLCDCCAVAEQCRPLRGCGLLRGVTRQQPPGLVGYA
ncbi:hypothetical protein AJ80_04071 [Polytolypa hystricis UAMH7299]|uniref:Uncharacterized protein n=1 Tax=Polytolypa hystricis (strain UAMH7299) TaxID=1447883 RepID=A0A2B7YEI6_POLH7|nr:hypothetical protein AJ80_04071 [Polytolypa hystricis UAMH7299]